MLQERDTWNQSTTKVLVVAPELGFEELGGYLCQPFFSHLRYTTDIRFLGDEQFGVHDTFGCWVAGKQSRCWMDRYFRVADLGLVATTGRCDISSSTPLLASIGGRHS